MFSFHNRQKVGKWCRVFLQVARCRTDLEKKCDRRELELGFGAPARALISER